MAFPGPKVQVLTCTLFLTYAGEILHWKLKSQVLQKNDILFYVVSPSQSDWHYYCLEIHRLILISLEEAMDLDELLLSFGNQ